MIVPYFHLKIGKIQILQVQNKETDFVRSIHVNNETIVICSRSEPEETNRKTLFVNGDNGHRSYRMILLGSQGDIYIEAINKLNKQQEL